MEMLRADAQSRAKIHELADLGAIVAELRAQGRRIVLCHGVFDLLHVGHIRHFNEARAFGDVLVVTLTEDKLVNKGPHRPAFGERLRAEAVASLEAVDYVAISRFPTAVQAIRTIRPDVYAKGPDYRTAADDVTGGILEEREAVEAAGGTIEFTSGETFSSSKLLNTHWQAFPAAVESYLAEFRQRHSASEVIEALNRLASLKVVVVGEAILDEYVYCDQMGKSAKDPTLAVRYTSSELFAGGALAVANHVASFCKSVELVTYLGSEGDPRETFIRSHLKPNVRANFIYKSASPTILKRRYVEASFLHKLFEVYEINDEPLTAAEDAQLCSLLEERNTGANVTIAADFGHGLITPAAMHTLSQSSRFLAVNTQINAANIRFHAISNYPRADYICINEGELRLDARSRFGELAGLVGSLREKMGSERILVTRGRAGVSYFNSSVQYESPAFATSVVDRIGSGDAVLAITSLCAATDAPADVVAFIANVIGAQKVQIMGNRAAIEKVSTVKFIEALLK